MRHIRNPIGVKLGPTTTAEDALALIDALEPEREPGRLTFITRMGAAKIREHLPRWWRRSPRAARRSRGSATRCTATPSRRRAATRPAGFDDVLDEVAGFFEVHRALGTHPGGIHIEFTGDDVTECVGGGHEIVEDDLHQRYETACDPRLNRSQSLDLAFMVAEMYRSA